jgi:hypothetical protein
MRCRDGTASESPECLAVSFGQDACFPSSLKACRRGSTRDLMGLDLPFAPVISRKKRLRKQDDRGVVDHGQHKSVGREASLAFGQLGLELQRQRVIPPLEGEDARVEKGTPLQWRCQSLGAVPRPVSGRLGSPGGEAHVQMCQDLLQDMTMCGHCVLQDDQVATPVLARHLVGRGQRRQGHSGL